MIYDLFIFTADGICLKSFEFNSISGSDVKKAETDLISSYLSAIYNIGLDLYKKKLSMIKFENIYYCFTGANDIIVCISCDCGDHDLNMIESILSEISGAFLSEYGYILKEWNGNRTKFENFMLPENFLTILNKKKSVIA
ncbi:MAG: hypothetical protein ACTSRW_14080 [Candidatus Helarchaeota archaeon]